MVRFPPGFRCERLRREHPRTAFSSGQEALDAWLARQALQNHEKHLSVTRVLLDTGARIAGYYTLATGQVDFGDLPSDLAKKLPRRALPVAVLAWLGVDKKHQGQGLGARLLAQALADCHAAGQTFAFVAVILDCIDDSAKSFYQRWDFQELPGRSMPLLPRHHSKAHVTLTTNTAPRSPSLSFSRQRKQSPLAQPHRAPHPRRRGASSRSSAVMVPASLGWRLPNQLHRAIRTSSIATFGFGRYPEKQSQIPSSRADSSAYAAPPELQQ
ncbi:MAG: GNAT family N-acetyltransferase [Polyangiaceae bacterium]